MHRILVATLLPAALVACTPDAPSLAVSDEAIIGGTLARDDHATVLLASYPANRSVLATCTGVLISPTVVVTAAHCVDNANHPNYIFGVFTGPDASIYPRLVDLEPHLLAVTSVHPHPNYNTNPPFRADIGVAILAEPITTITPIKLWRDPVGPLVGQPARIIGYGQETVGTFSSTRRQAVTVVDGLDPGDTVRVGDPQHLTCLGDSGGPALVAGPNGTEVLLGIDSYADNGNCDRPAHFRRAEVYQTFLDGYTGDAPPMMIDGGLTPIDAAIGLDAGTNPGADSDDGGCSTSSTPATAAGPLSLALALLLGARKTRARARV